MPLTAIRTEGLSKRYGTITALDALNLEVPENVVFGYLGPNGAGKTTTVRLLTGFSRPTSGRAWVADEKVGDGDLALHGKIGLLPDVPAFYDWMTGREFLRYAGELHRLRPADIKARAAELLELVDLTKAADRRVGGYSRGMRQRLGIAQALVNRPSVLFMDEPTSALDPVGRREVLDLILRLKENATVFMSTHILSDVERVCDMVGIIDRGKLVTVSSVDALRRQHARSAFEMEFMEDARSFVEMGAASMILDGQLDGERLASEIAKLIDTPRKLREMSTNALQRARPQAAEKIAAALLRYAPEDAAAEGENGAVPANKKEGR